MAFQIKRKAPEGAASHMADKFEDAVHVARDLIEERIPKARTTITNLKTGETMNEAEIAEAAISVGPRKRRSAAA